MSLKEIAGRMRRSLKRVPLKETAQLIVVLVQCLADRKVSRAEMEKIEDAYEALRDAYRIATDEGEEAAGA